MQTPLSPKPLGSVPTGLSSYHRDFLQKIKDNLHILMGALRSQYDTDLNPGSKAVTFDDLERLGLIVEGATGIETDGVSGYSKTFMHMGAF